MYSFDARIRYSETDEAELLTIEGLLDYFQDCSTFQSEDLGIGVSFLRKYNLAWVINSWQIDVNRFPAMGERVRVSTCPYQFRGFLGYRNFLMETAEGERLAAATTIWTLLNMETGRPTQPTREMIEGYAVEPKLDMEYLPRKILLPKNEDGTPAAGVKKSVITVGRQHLDTNNHVNNGQYVRMAIQSLALQSPAPQNLVSQSLTLKNTAPNSREEEEEAALHIRRLRVEYKMQAHLGDEITPVVYREPEHGRTVALNNAEGESYAVVQLVDRF